MQHTETSFEVLENAHGQDHKRIRGLRRTLGKKDLSIDSNCLVRVWSVVRTNGSRSGDKVGAGKAGRKHANQRGCTHDQLVNDTTTNLIHLVNAICPDRLNRPINLGSERSTLRLGHHGRTCTASWTAVPL